MGLSENAIVPRQSAEFWFVQTLTLVRMPLIFSFMAVAVFARPPSGATAFWIALAAMILAAVTDLLDGHFARKFQVTSRFGSYADPMVDKVYYLVTLPTLLFLAHRAGQATQATALLLLTVIFLLRDQWVSFLRSVGAVHGCSAKANWSGKARTLVSFPTICVVYFYLEAPPNISVHIPAAAVYTLEIASTAINLISIAVYTKAYWPALLSELRRPGGG